MKAFTLLAVAAALLSTPATRADEATEKIDALDRIAYGTKKVSTDAERARAAPEERVRVFGLAYASVDLATLESEVDRLIAANAMRNTLTERLNALQALSGTNAVSQAEGRIGALSADDIAAGRESRPLSWHCSKIDELKRVLPARMQSLADFGVSYIRELRAIPVGRDDSAARVDALTRQFDEQLNRWLDDPANRALAQDMAFVRAGVGNARGSSTALLGAADAATRAAANLKTEARTLETRGSYLVDFVDAYLDRREELADELPTLRALELEFPADLSRRTAILNLMESASTPRRTVAQWRKAVDDAVTLRSKAADDATAQIETLSATLRSENAACGRMSDPAQEFSALVQQARRELDSILNSASAAWADRSTAIRNLDKEHADLIDENQKQAEDMGRQVTAAEARYDSMSPGPERDRLYANIRQARELGAEAARAAIDLQVARQGLLNEQQGAQRAAGNFTVRLSASANALLEVTSN